jgi:RNA polymerase sigma-70 factor (ECF subfamily)
MSLTTDNSRSRVLFRFPTARFRPQKKLIGRGNKSSPVLFYDVVVSEEDLQLVSFEELAMPLFDQLYNFAQWLTQNRDEAEDLVQETYAKALKGFSSFRVGTNFRAWIYRILRNTFLTSRTGLKATMTVPLDTEEDAPQVAIEHDTPETLLFERSDRERLQRAIDQLPVYFREILLLCDVEEMSYQEISETLAVPIGTVMSRLSRARRTLRDSLRPLLQQGLSASSRAKGTDHGL